MNSASPSVAIQVSGSKSLTRSMGREGGGTKAPDLEGELGSCCTFISLEGREVARSADAAATVESHSAPEFFLVSSSPGGSDDCP